MSYMFEVYYRSPADTEKEAVLTQRVVALGGRLDYREPSQSQANGSICLTFEFGRREEAEAAARVLREQGEHVEGPVEYGEPATRVATDALVFIDTQHYLDLYRTETGKELLALIEEVRERIFVTQQVFNEVERHKLQEALGFFANKCPNLKSQQDQIKDISGQLPEHLFDVSGSTIASIREKLEKANELKKESNKFIRQADKILEQAIGDTLRDISVSKDVVSEALKPLFGKAVYHKSEELQRAQERKIRGVPPGKNAHTVCDQLNWEQLLSFVKANRIRRVWFISRDSDYIIKYRDKVFLNPVLYQELMAATTAPLEVYTHDLVVAGIRHFTEVTDFKAKNFPSPEKEEAFRKEQEALPPSVTSGISPLVSGFIDTGIPGLVAASGMGWQPVYPDQITTSRRAAHMYYMSGQGDQEWLNTAQAAAEQQRRAIAAIASSTPPPSPSSSGSPSASPASASASSSCAPSSSQSPSFKKKDEQP